ncbi:MAG: trehalose utilization protein ThuA [Clostridiales bacterium]|nr:trehalose utilization protein ThuA [Clostridiales bacterium]
MLRITVWNENFHEKHLPGMKERHPEGLHGTIAAILRQEEDFVVRTATQDDPECGLTEEVLNDTDVLFWWGHVTHNDVPDSVVERVHNHVLQGMGLVVLHSGHFSKIFRKVCGTPCNLTWHDDSKERLFVVNPGHPIAQGLPPYFEIPNEECYGEPFGIPEPDELVFLGWYNTGEVFRSGCCFHRCNGRIFYFQPGHETDSSFFIPEVQQIYKNAARWCAPVKRVPELTCPFQPPLEKVD